MEGPFEKREKSAEAKWALDEETRFKVFARRNKRLGLWAASLMGLSGGDAETYALTVVKADFDRPGEEDVFEKIQADFKAKGVTGADEKIRTAMAELLTAAVHELTLETKAKP